MSEKLALLIDSFAILEELYHESIDESSKYFVKLFGIGYIQAIDSAAVYSTERDSGYLGTYCNEDRWNGFRSQLKDDTQALFNHGDGKQETSVILLLTNVYPQTGDQPEIVNDMLVLAMRLNNKIVNVAMMSNRGSGTLHAFPILVLDEVEKGANFHGWALREKAPTKEDGGAMFGLYSGALSYLNDQLAVGVKTGRYGDGVKYNALMTNALSSDWLRD